MANFTNLEDAALKATCTGQAGLASAFDKAKVASKENTGQGFYTSIETDPSTPCLECFGGIVNGPNLRVKVGRTEVPMGFILWMKAGRPACLEGFQYATEEGEIDLKLHDLLAMTALGEWS